MGSICILTLTVSRKCPETQASNPETIPLLKSTMKLFILMLVDRLCEDYYHNYILHPNTLLFKANNLYQSILLFDILNFFSIYWSFYILDYFNCSRFLTYSITMEKKGKEEKDKEDK